MYIYIYIYIYRASCLVPGSSSSCEGGAAAPAWLPSPMVEKIRVHHSQMHRPMPSKRQGRKLLSATLPRRCLPMNLPTVCKDVQCILFISNTIQFILLSQITQYHSNSY